MRQKFVRSIAYIAILISSSATYQLSAQDVSAEEMQQSKQNFEKAERGDFVAIRQHALNLLEKGAYPDFRPDPRGAVSYLERILLTYTGENREQLEINARTYRKYADAFEAQLASAARGEPEGLYGLANRYNYDKSIGVRQDKAKALSLFKQAADKGHLEAHRSAAMILYHEIPGGRDEAILYMQRGEARGLKSAGYWLDQWGAPRSPELAQAKANSLAASNAAATNFAAGSFSPNFWGSTPISEVQRRIFARSELIPILEQVKAGGGALPASKSYKAWGMALGSSPSQQQLLRTANNVLGCVLAPVTPRTVAGIDLQKSASIDYEEWTLGNRRALRIGCATESAGFRVPGTTHVLFYLVDTRVVAVQVNFSIYDAAQDNGSGRIVCSAPKYSPANLVARETIGPAGWTIARQHNLSKTPLNGIRYGHWYTLTRPGAVMHIFPKRWPYDTIEGTSTVAKCGTGTVEYLIATPQFNAALGISNARLPSVRIGRDGSLMEEES